MAGEASRQNGKKGGRPHGSKTATTRARERGHARALKRLEITAERTMLELGRHAFADRRGIFQDGNLKPFNEWTADEGALLEGFEVIIKNAQAGDNHTDTVHKVHLAKKFPALEVLAKHFGIVRERLEVTVELALSEKVARARARLQQPVALLEEKAGAAARS